MRWLKYLAATIVTLFVVIPLGAYLLLATTSGSKWLLTTALNFTAINVSYETFEGRLLDNFTLRNVRYTTDEQLIDISQVSVHWHPIALLDGELQLERLTVLETQLQQLTSAASTDSANPVELPELRLPLNLRINQLTLADVSYQPATGDISELPFELEARLAWQESQLDLRRLRVTSQLNGSPLSFDGSLSVQTANAYPVDLDGEYQAELPQPDIDLSPIQGSLTVSGAIAEQLQIQSDFSAANTPQQSLTLRLSQLLITPVWLANVQLNKLPLQPFIGLTDSAAQLQPFFGADTAVSGQLEVNEVQVELNEVQVSKLGDSEGRLTLNGSWQHEGFTPNYQQTTFDLTIAVQAFPYSLNEQQFTVEQLEAKVAGSLNDYNFDLTSQVAVPPLDNNLFRPDSLELTLEGEGTLQSAQLETLQVGGESLDLNASADIVWAPELQMQINVSNARARLNAPEITDPIQLSGAFKLTGNALNFNELRISYASTEVVVDGTTAGTSYIEGELVSQAPAELPFMPSAMQEIEQLNLNFALSANDQLSAFALTIAELSVVTESFSTITATEPSEFNFELGNETWRLSNEALCVADSDQRFGSICTTVDANPQTLQLGLDGDELSLWLLNRLRAEDVAERVAGDVDIDAALTLDTATFKIRSLEATIVSDNTVFFALDQETSTRLERWEITATGDAEAVTATLDAQLSEDQGAAMGELTLRDPNDTQAINGELLFALDDLAMLDWVLPGMRYEGGKATASLNLSGTLAEPSIGGDMEVFAETVGFAQTNLVSSDVRLALLDNPETDGELEIQGQARSGDTGAIFVEGVAMPLEQEAYLSIEGSNFRALQMPTATVDITPDLTIYINENLIDIAGTVDVPYAQISAPEFDTAVSRSPDVIVTRNGEPVEPNGNTMGNLQVQAAVRVNLGDQVSVNAYGFEGRLTGSLELVEQPRRPLTAVGSINVAEGSYTLYGQELAIDRGAFIYNGGQVSNPGLNLRVQRSINTSDALSQVSVGAQVGGTLTDPDFRLFSTPAMPDSEILSYLLLGRSMQSAATTGTGDIQLKALLMLGAKGTEALSGSIQDTFGIDEVGVDTDPTTRETSFYIGKYLSPRLYIKYGIGLLESTNTFMMRYQLTEQILIKTMSSTRSQSGDIFYTFER
ncbi:translocation/assembly module TamB domain-containing protein [Pseudidiomarina insulisalsae]|uniref:Translocation and assembly module TamB C-terminal domain-containing protein n=1 Tax=Pseudidiomarina insulisalsae TaxID=575789 RepID=A0A432Y8T7_9GAMM|nr:translocation/assembly module TamB domain-containing protein [Pseudidiomarina insulisalsae]RUO57311.1 hypothetical protein CWI71_11680 [Pseudidiomarina insulisalsae]